ncbi:MAG: dipeptidase [Pseudonocardiales bacterium]|nr:dipeptidase [Pseudonocardiales bacterium]
MTRRIVALGGGGFSMEPENPVLDDHVLALAGVPRPRVLFVPTASGDSAEYIGRFRDAFPAERAEASVLTFFERTVEDLRALVLAQHVVYVGGGSTANLLAVWRLHGLDTVLFEAYAAGVVLAGISAGMNCWFAASVTDSFGPRLAGLPDGLGLLPFSACPHYDGEEQRRPTYRRLVAEGFPGGYAADEGAALVFTDGTLTEVVASRAGAGGYRVERVDGAVRETPLPGRLLTR